MISGGCILSLRVKIPYIYLVDTGVHTDALALIPESVALEIHMVCFKKEDMTLSIAVHDPTDPRVNFELKKLGNTYTINLFVASHESINYVLAFYKDLSNSQKVHDNIIDITDINKDRN